MFKVNGEVFVGVGFLGEGRLTSFVILLHQFALNISLIQDVF
jgi:hypothetical protein